MREVGDDVRFSCVQAQAGNVQLARVSGLKCGPIRKHDHEFVADWGALCNEVACGSGVTDGCGVGVDSWVRGGSICVVADDIFVSSMSLSSSKPVSMSKRLVGVVGVARTVEGSRLFILFSSCCGAPSRQARWGGALRGITVLCTACLEMLCPLAA